MSLNKTLFSFFVFQKHSNKGAIILSCFFAALLAGCSSTQYYGSSTSVIKKHAKRGYNKSYKIKGNRYYPRKQYEYSEVGTSSYYGGRDVFHGRKTSTGERFNKNGMTAAHKTLPLPCVVRVTNMKNGRSIKLRVNDRGPFIRGRIIDVSEKAARLLGFHHDGIAKVRVECLVSESMILAKNYNPKRCNPYTIHGKCSRRHYVRNIKTPRKPKSFQTYSTMNVPRGTYIQVGTYSSKTNAINFANKVESRMRVPCKAYNVEKGAKNYHRVLMGPMKTKNAITKMLHDLKIRNVIDAFVVVQR